MRWSVVGGGMLGMTLAWRLVRAGHEVELYEAAAELGGLAGAWQLDDVVWDRHYHVTLLSDWHLRGLLAELELEGEMRWRKSQTGFFAGGRLYPMSNAWEFLRFPALGMVDKVRLAGTILYAAQVRDAKALYSISAVDWLTKLSGRSTVENLWRPLLESKLGSNADRVAATFIQATIARLYAARRSGLKEELFGYLPGGYARLLERFAARLREAGVKIHTGCRLSEVGPGPCLRFENGQESRPDAAVSTTPDATVEYQGLLCASVLLRQPLSPYYVTNLVDKGLPFTGVIDMTALVEAGTFGGRGLVYLPRYAAPGDEAWGWTDERLRAEFLAGLRRVYPGLAEGDVLAFQVSRVRRVFPLPLTGASGEPPPAVTETPGMFRVNSAQIVNGTLNVNETVLLAERAAAWLMAGEGKIWQEAGRPLERTAGATKWTAEDAVLWMGCGGEGEAGPTASMDVVDTDPLALARGRIANPGIRYHLLDGGRPDRMPFAAERRFSVVAGRVRR